MLASVFWGHSNCEGEYGFFFFGKIDSFTFIVNSYLNLQYRVKELLL